MSLRATDAARLQLRHAVSLLLRRSKDDAAVFVEDVSVLLTTRSAVEKTARPFTGLSDVAVTEIVRSGYRLFFREVDGTLWLTGVWHTPSS